MGRTVALAHLRRLQLLRSRAPLALILGLLGLAAWAAASPSEDSLISDSFSRACSSLDAGDLDSAARDIPGRWMWKGNNSLFLRRNEAL